MLRNSLKAHDECVLEIVNCTLYCSSREDVTGDSSEVVVHIVHAHARILYFSHLFTHKILWCRILCHTLK